ncbi:MAG: 2-amino-4-hydroxy-6-hydroxymethyldihydropteridine diphosphokinase [Myxococcaceae bacterium]
MSIYFIGVGSSHPNGTHYIDRAYEELKRSAHIQALAESPRYPNPAFGGQTLFRFLNSAFKIETQLHPDALWFLLHSLELKLGRIRLVKNGPRTIDLDILWSSAGAIKTHYVEIPHPEFKKRPFALKPATDIGFA